MTHWWRAYDGSIDHPKLLKLPSDAYRWAWFTLQCVASANGGVLPPTVDIAARLRMKPTKIADWIATLVKSGLIDNEDGVFRPHNWDTRQYKSDVTDPTASQRMQRYRDKKRNERNATVTVIRPETEQIQTTENRADTRDETQKRVGDFRQAIVRAYSEANSPTLPDTSRAELWITQGYQEDICLAVIAGIVRKRPNVGLSYFDSPIAEAHTKKAPPRKAINGNPPLDWDQVLTTFKKIGHWSRDAGPDLDSPACRAPPEMLEKYGLSLRRMDA